MKRKSVWLSFTACAVTMAGTVQPAPATEPSKVAIPEHSQVQVFAYKNGQTGFFERNTGKLYIYDSSLKNCVAIRQVGWLGEELQTVEGSPLKKSANPQDTFPIA